MNSTAPTALDPNTAAFLTRFKDLIPTMEVNVNCLLDLACPECGSRGGFRIEVKGVVPMCDEGTDATEGDVEHDDSSFCQCSDCAHQGKVADFTFPGLDAELVRLQSGQS